MKRGVNFRDLEYISNKVVKISILKKISEIKDIDEKIRLYEYSISSVLDLKYQLLKEKILKLERKKKDVFIPLTKLHLLRSRMGFFKVTFLKKDFKDIMKLFKDIEKELK